ncbi:unnamed protein product [Trichobilharzia regenti]|nr:unnamed protein product [Trichobilharzia regenti]
MVSEGGLSSDSGSDLEASGDSDLSDSRLDNLVDDIIEKLALYPSCKQSEMTIKNRKDRVKSERDPPGTSTNSRHSFAFKPYPYNEERKEMASHRNRHRCVHIESNINQDIEAPRSPLSYSFPVDSSLYPAHSAFNHPPTRHISQQIESLSPTDCRPHVRENKTSQVKPQPTIVDDASGNNSEDEYYFGKQPRRASPIQLAEPDLIARAIRESESTQLEEAMLRDKLAETEQDAIDRCIEDQAVRESYFDYLQQISVPVNQKINPNNSVAASESTDALPSQKVSMDCRIPANLTKSSDVASSSKASVPDIKTRENNMSTKEPLPSSSNSQSDMTLRHIPPCMLGK